MSDIPGRPTLVPSRFRPPERIVDAGLAILLTVLIGGGLFPENRVEHGGTLHWQRLVAETLLTTLPLAWRRRWPVPVLGVEIAAVLAEGAFHDPAAAGLPMMVAVYTVATRCSHRTALLAAAVASLALFTEMELAHVAVTIPGAVSRIATPAAACAVGLWVRTRRDYVEQLRETAERLSHERRLLARQAVAEERVRIARELHDVVAHHVSLMVVQAGAVRETVDAAHPSRPVLESMARTGREALAEMRHMLGVLRLEDTADGAGRAPQPGIADLGPLIEQARGAGLPVELRVEGTARPLPPGVDLSAYRIVQEALTNTLRHAGPTEARVLLRYRPDALEVRVSDSGRGSAAPPSGGHGLIGMRERVALFGGELVAGAVPGGGFAVRAVLPLGGPATLQG
ncbi:MAG: sensor histidine kinase [Chloroflexi bacterium]|nr:MAG: sensor histidine kinase [Chloroflexota bacterium]